MNTSNLASVIATVTLFASTVAHAEISLKDNLNNQFASKRHYLQAVENTDQKQSQEWEGATLVTNKELNTARMNKLLVHRMNIMNRRAL